MLNLVKYRKLFILISLLIIIPGVIALFLFGLNLSIDFTDGSNATLRPQKPISSQQVTDILKPFNLNSEQVVLGNDQGTDKTSSQKTIWVRFNTQIDDNVRSDVQKKLEDKFKSALNYKVSNVPGTNGQGYTLYAITGFTNVPNVSDIRAALENLPKTSDITKAASGTNATATATPAVQGPATPKTQASPTTAATPTANANPATIPVKVEDVTQGTTNQTINILTRSTISTAPTGAKNEITIPQIQGAFQKAGIYVFALSNSNVGPAVANETTRNAFLAVLAASAFILLYIWFSFRKVARPLRYGVCAIIALLHDVLVVVGIFSILGKLFDIQVDALFITGLLTVVGFSVHDTIVVFDRVRENMQRRTHETFEEIVNASLVQTLARSLNTSLTVLFTLLTLFLFTGIGTSIHTFTLTLLIGIFSGTYSSIFNASMLLVMWDKGEWGFKYLGGGKRDQVPVRREREARELVRAQ